MKVTQLLGGYIRVRLETVRDFIFGKQNDNFAEELSLSSPSEDLIGVYLPCSSALTASCQKKNNFR